MNTQPDLDRETLNTLMRALPVHIFCFDRQLVCRYAAPIGPHFLGCPAEELPGKPVESLFPAEVALRPRLEFVLRAQQPCHLEHVPYPSGPDGSWLAGAWEIEIRPCMPNYWSSPTSFAPEASAGAAVHRFPAEPAILMTCIEKPVAAAPALNPVAQARGTEAATRDPTRASLSEAHRAAALLERIRTKLTIVRGFAQLLGQRHRRDHPDDDLYELEHINEATRELDELLYQYEYRTWPPSGSPGGP